MQISLKEKSKRLAIVTESLENKDQSSLPAYLSLDKAACKGELVVAPELDQIASQLPLPVNVSVICEFLSHRT